MANFGEDWEELEREVVPDDLAKTGLPTDQIRLKLQVSRGM